VSFLDFCAGSDDVGSPLGTMQGMIAENGYTDDSLPYQALDYYGAVSTEGDKSATYFSLTITNAFLIMFLHLPGLLSDEPVGLSV
jgi:hypothetical protein